MGIRNYYREANEKISPRRRDFLYVYLNELRFITSSCVGSAGFNISNALIKNPDIGNAAWIMIIVNKICGRVKCNVDQPLNNASAMAGVMNIKAHNAAVIIHNTERRILNG